MIDRRDVLTMGGLLGALVPGRDAAAEGVGTGAGQTTMSERTAQDVVDAMKNIAKVVAADHSFAEIGAVRKAQMDYLRANSKFPDFIDVAADVWMNVYDWHIRLQQPLVANRDPQGRYTLVLGFSTLVMRHDFVLGFIATPYDNR